MKEISVIYEDNHVIVVIKPQNIPTQADESGDEDMLSLVKEYIKIKYDKPGNVYVGLVHRLDRPTGGLLVFAKTSKAAARLSEQIKNGEFSKKYLTVVVGQPKDKTKKLEHFLKKDENTNTVKIVPQGETGAKKAELIYNVADVYSEYIEVPAQPKEKRRIDQYEELINIEVPEIRMEKKITHALSLVEIELLTGRSHQIRVQMASLKTPVYGDAKYGEMKEQMTSNLALWAYKLNFIHPTTKQLMSFKVLPNVENEPWAKFSGSEVFKK